MKPACKEGLYARNEANLLEMKQACKSNKQDYHIALISKICAYFRGCCLRKKNLIISKKRAYFGSKIVLLRNL